MRTQIKLYLIVFFSILAVYAQKKEYYFYNPEIDYGSEHTLTPAAIFLNGSYDVLRNGGHENNGEIIDVFKLDYESGFINVWDKITKPAYDISR